MPKAKRLCCIGIVAFALALASARCGDRGPTPVSGATGLSLGTDPLVLTVRGSTRLNPVFDGPAEPLKYSSSDPNIVSVDSAGLLTAAWPGTVTITAQGTRTPALTGSVKVQVTGVAVRVFLDTSIVLDGSASDARVKLGGTDDDRVAFSSSDRWIVDVSPAGLVCARQVGQAWIRVRSLADTTAMDSTSVRVAAPPPGGGSATSGAMWPVLPMSLPSITDSAGNPVDLSAVRGNVNVGVTWDAPPCYPTFTVIFTLDTKRESGPEVRWGGSGRTSFRLDTRAVNAAGEPVVPNGDHWIAVQALATGSKVYLGGGWQKFRVANP